ncbi:MAG: sigma-70 family RNA polymerase sigma factor [Lachnospiraceae bacterium]|nr:sigma-70 family RNA polymerase sigma factor [Lachnospiraceae bacterium]
MKDIDIINLFVERNENAIKETKIKYNSYLMAIADNILHCFFDDEECVNDTYFKTWNTIPPTLPKNYQAYIGRITRNGALNRLREQLNYKHKSLCCAIRINELEEIFGTNRFNPENDIDNKLIGDLINKFLRNLPQQKRVIFVRRYWYMDSIKQISERMKLSEIKVKITLKRMRDELKKILIEEELL